MALAAAMRDFIDVLRSAARRGAIFLIGGVAGTALLATSARGGDLRCERGLVVPGDTAAAILERCGAPKTRQRIGSRGLGAPRSGGGTTADREVWTYDLGSGRLLRHLTFRKGRLVQIDVGSYSR